MSDHARVFHLKFFARRFSVRKTGNSPWGTVTLFTLDSFQRLISRALTSLLFRIFLYFLFSLLLLFVLCASFFLFPFLFSFIFFFSFNSLYFFKYPNDFHLHREPCTCRMLNTLAADNTMDSKLSIRMSRKFQQFSVVHFWNWRLLCKTCSMHTSRRWSRNIKLTKYYLLVKY